MNLWFVIGTRPEMIKMAPVIKEALKRFEVNVILTGQHEAVGEMANNFEIDVRTNLSIQSHNLDDMIRKILSGLEFEVATQGTLPHAIVVQGDTSSAMAASLWGFNNQIPVAHIEAGLRTYDKHNPFPEEGNRRIISSIATYHYAPTPASYNTLLRERVEDEVNIKMTGNTVIDALKMVPEGEREWYIPTALITLHRRESWGQPLIQTMIGVLDWLDKSDMQAIWPIHPGTEVQNTARTFHHPKLIKTKPMNYPDFVKTMRGCRFLLTDSGGVQEEASALGKYTIVVRHETERPEAIREGVARLVPPNRAEIKYALNKAERCWEDVKPSDVFGDGNSAKRIIAHLSQRLNDTNPQD